MVLMFSRGYFKILLSLVVVMLWQPMISAAQNQTLSTVTTVSACGNPIPLKFDLVIPKAITVAAYPAVIIVHGGGWMGGSRKDDQGLQSLLANMGLASMSVDYRLAPQARFPAQIEDLKCAIRWLHQHAAEQQIDPERIAGFGISAGAHLTALAALTPGKWNTVDRSNQSSDALRCAILHAPPLDFPDWWQTADPQMKGTMSPRFMMNNLFGKDFSQAQSTYKEASPSTYVAHAQKEKTPPLLIIHGEQDVTVPIRASQTLVDQLAARGIAAELMRIPDADHFGFGSHTRQVVEKIRSFYAQCLK